MGARYETRNLWKPVRRRRYCLWSSAPESWYESASQTILGGPKAASSYTARLFFGLVENELPVGHENQHDVDADRHEEVTGPRSLYHSR
jgi:hypothetical protein